MRNTEKLFFIRKRLAVMAWVCLGSLCIFCGCTKKEELVLLTEDGQGQAQLQEISAETAQVKEAERYAGEAGKSSVPAYIEEEPESVYVHVCGAVISPGVYRLDAGSRVYEAVQAAGGFAENAEESYVNQAQELPDGVKLVIPTKEEAILARQEDMGGQEASEWEDGRQADDGRININTATVEELCRIPGIGSTRAAAIVSYRDDHGGFKSPEDIMQVSGIKEGTYEKIKDSIIVK